MEWRTHVSCQKWSSILQPDAFGLSMVAVNRAEVIDAEVLRLTCQEWGGASKRVLHVSQSWKDAEAVGWVVGGAGAGSDTGHL